MSDEQRIYDRCIVRVGQLEAENEQLRRERDFYFQQVTENGERAHRTIDALKAENEKLRELVRNLYACINNRDCDYCEYVDEACEFARNMSELGVEV